MEAAATMFQKGLDLVAKYNSLKTQEEKVKERYCQSLKIKDSSLEVVAALHRIKAIEVELKNVESEMQKYFELDQEAAMDKKNLEFLGQKIRNASETIEPCSDRSKELVWDINKTEKKRSETESQLKIVLESIENEKREVNDLGTQIAHLEEKRDRKIANMNELSAKKEKLKHTSDTLKGEKSRKEEELNCSRDNDKRQVRRLASRQGSLTKASAEKWETLLRKKNNGIPLFKTKTEAYKFAESNQEIMESSNAILKEYDISKSKTAQAEKMLNVFYKELYEQMTPFVTETLSQTLEYLNSETQSQCGSEGGTAIGNSNEQEGEREDGVSEEEEKGEEEEENGEREKKGEEGDVKARDERQAKAGRQVAIERQAENEKTEGNSHACHETADLEKGTEGQEKSKTFDQPQTSNCINEQAVGEADELLSEQAVGEACTEASSEEVEDQVTSQADSIASCESQQDAAAGDAQLEAEDKRERSKDDVTPSPTPFNSQNETVQAVNAMLSQDSQFSELDTTDYEIFNINESAASNIVPSDSAVLSNNNSMGPAVTSSEEVMVGDVQVEQSMIAKALAIAEEQRLADRRKNAMIASASAQALGPSCHSSEAVPVSTQPFMVETMSSSLHVSKQPSSISPDNCSSEQASMQSESTFNANSSITEGIPVPNSIAPNLPPSVLPLQSVTAERPHEKSAPNLLPSVLPAVPLKSATATATATATAIARNLSPSVSPSVPQKSVGQGSNSQKRQKQSEKKQAPKKARPAAEVYRKTPLNSLNYNDNLKSSAVLNRCCICCDSISRLSQNQNLSSHYRFGNCKVMNFNFEETIGSTLKFKCIFCAEIFTCCEQKAYHFMHKHGDETITCSVCFKTVKVNNLKKHKLWHLEEVEENEKLNCMSCSFKGVARDFIDHITSIHNFAISKINRHQLEYFSDDSNHSLAIIALMHVKESFSKKN